MTNDPPIWRLIPPLQAPGAVQMEIDRWLLEQHRCGLHPPTLRFYTWSPPAISLGYHQQRWSPHWQQLTWQGEAIELVRRPTGGRAVLHQGDLTYAVVMSSPQRNRMQSYRWICEFLIAGWRSLGLELHYGSDRDYCRSPNCFETATSADLVDLNGVKWIGSAQLRREKAILQHGSMRIEPDGDLFSQVFDRPMEPLNLPFAHRGKAAIDVVVEALTTAATECFGVHFAMQPFSDAEWQAVLRDVSNIREPQLIPKVRPLSNPDCERLTPEMS